MEVAGEGVSVLKTDADEGSVFEDGGGEGKMLRGCLVGGDKSVEMQEGEFGPGQELRRGGELVWLEAVELGEKLAEVVLGHG